MASQKQILDKIIKVGGLLGRCASMYYDDKDLSKKFICELEEDCDKDHFKMIIGNRLAKDIKVFCKNNK